MYICRRDASNIYRVNTAPFFNPQGIAINFPMTSRENYPVACLPSKVVRLRGTQGVRLMRGLHISTWGSYDVITEVVVHHGKPKWCRCLQVAMHEPCSRFVVEWWKNLTPDFRLFALRWSSPKITRFPALGSWQRWGIRNDLCRETCCEAMSPGIHRSCHDMKSYLNIIVFITQIPVSHDTETP